MCFDAIFAKSGFVQKLKYGEQIGDVEDFISDLRFFLDCAMECGMCLIVNSLLWITDLTWEEMVPMTSVHNPARPPLGPHRCPC